MSRIATIEIDGKKYELPIIEGSENELAIDIKKITRINRWANHY